MTVETAKRQAGVPRRAAWCLVPIAAAFAAMSGAFSGSSVFYVRDLAQYYYPLHAWYRNAVFGGEFPLWDPYVGFGQSAIADPARHLLFPPVVLIRLLLPETLGFNLSVALPFPIAAAGMFVLLRRRASDPAAALGAAIFALSGPVLTTGNFLNMSWAVAAIPWILLCVDRLASSTPVATIAALSVLFALQFLAGEPVTLSATALVAVAYAAYGAHQVDTTMGERARVVAATVLAGAVGLCLAAPQALPLLDASQRSARSLGLGSGYAWIGSMNPLQWLELVAPWLFGDPMASYFSPPPVLNALNGGIEPIFYSIYLGICPLVLAVCGVLLSKHPRWTRFWIGLAVISLLWSAGPHTPFYTLAVKVLPPLGALRFPSKITVFLALGVSALAATGWDRLGILSEGDSPGARRAPVLAAVAIATPILALLAGLFLNPGLLQALIGAKDETLQIAEFVVRSFPTTIARFAVLASATALLVWVARYRPELAPRATALLFLLAVADLLVVNASLNPTTEAASLGVPPWVDATREHPHDRVYVGPRIYKAARVETDIDAPQLVDRGLTGLPDLVVRAREDAELLSFPSRASVRDSISIDQQALWPLEDLVAKERFKKLDRASRTRFLLRTAVRYFVVPESLDASAAERAALPGFPSVRLYESQSPMPRAWIARSALVVPLAAGQIDRLSESDFDPFATVVVDREPAVGTSVAAGTPVPESATIVEDRSGRVVIDAGVSGDGGYLVLSDSYDPNWTSLVDGTPTEIVRADGLFRAVRLPMGSHRVEFSYRPTPFYRGLWVALGAVVLLGVAWIMERRSRRSAR